jgi:hypothetical protein
MTRLALLLTATLLAGCATTAPPAAYKPEPIVYGAGMRSMDAMASPPMVLPYTPPMRSQIVNLGGTPYYVNEAHGVTTVTPGVLQPLRPVTLRPLN